MGPELQRQVQNPVHIVPTAWVRGGEDTRDATRTPAFIGSQRTSPSLPETWVGRMA